MLLTAALAIASSPVAAQGTGAPSGAATPKRPQEPKPPFPYAAEDVSYRNEAAGIRLAGTLTRPQAGGPFASVLLITGAGSQDRDETLFGHKPFLVIADHLTRRGLAVLRVDDRGVGRSDRSPGGATTQDSAGDVLAGVAYLKTRADIDPTRIGLAGHSEGANIAAIVAAGSPEIRFIIMLAGAGVPGDAILFMQAAALARARGASAEAIEWDRSVRARVYELLKSEVNGVADTTRRQTLLDQLPPAPGASDQASARQLGAALLKVGSGAWYRHFLSYDPAPTLVKVKCPVLVLIGENDVQVPPEENVRAIRRALVAGGNTDHTAIIPPRLNHFYQTSVTGLPDEYARIEETFAPTVLELMTGWILKRVAR